MTDGKRHLPEDITATTEAAANGWMEVDAPNSFSTKLSMPSNCHLAQVTKVLQTHPARAQMQEEKAKP